MTIYFIYGNIIYVDYICVWNNWVNDTWIVLIIISIYTTNAVWSHVILSSSESDLSEQNKTFRTLFTHIFRAPGQMFIRCL